MKVYVVYNCYDSWASRLEKIFLSREAAEKFVMGDPVSELLDFQKADVLNNTMKPVEVRVITVLEGIIDKFCMMANDKHITIEISDCPKDIIISLDYKLGAKLFDNLLSNAIKYTPEGGRITLRANTYKGKVKIDVKDNGMGIPKDDQKKILLQ